MKRALLKVVWENFRERWPVLVAFMTACGVFGCLTAATPKPSSRLPSTAANPAAEVANDNLICGERKWVIPDIVWGPPQSIPPSPSLQVEGPTYFRSGVLYSNLQVTWIDEGPPVREHKLVMRSIRLKEVVKFFRHKAVEEEIEAVK